MASEDYNIMMIKGKRSKRQRQMVSSSSSSSLALTMAATTSSPSTSSSDTSPARDKNNTQVEQDMADCLILLAQGHQSQKSPAAKNYIDTIADLYMYQCKTCDRSFPSFQALGGHRASHKRPKATAAIDIEPSVVNQQQTSSSSYYPDTNTILSLQISSTRSDQACDIKIGKNKSLSNKVHECSMCGAEFTSGQALGGHMRRHRSSLPPRAIMPSLNHDADELKKPLTNGFSLDLNLPAPSEDMDQQHTESKFACTYNEQVNLQFTKREILRWWMRWLKLGCDLE